MSADAGYYGALVMLRFLQDALGQEASGHKNYQQLQAALEVARERTPENEKKFAKSDAEQVLYQQLLSWLKDELRIEREFQNWRQKHPAMQELFAKKVG
jgi:hypothetical protein